MKSINTHLTVNFPCIQEISLFEKLMIKKDYIYWMTMDRLQNTLCVLSSKILTTILLNQCN